MTLTINWDDFSKQIDSFVNEGQIILDKEGLIKTEPDFEKIKTDIKQWGDKCFEYLKSSFDSNEFSQEFYYAKEQRYNFGNRQQDFGQIKKETFADLKVKINFLDYNKRIFSISDVITKPKIVDLNKRKLFTTDETLELILDKLYDLYDNFFHPIGIILEGNGITLKRHGEDRELAKMLEDNGYVNLTHTRDTSGQLTLKGKMYVEEKRKTYKENYEDINKSKEEINSRVDEIIEKLTKLGYGQEIIFDEIEELKELYTTLNKKNWGQVVKGKLVDLALAKLIENDTLKYIYEKLTDHTLRLP